MFTENKSTGLILSIIFGALVIGGSLVFLGFQMNSSPPSGASVLDADLEELKKLLAEDIVPEKEVSKPKKVKPVDRSADHIRGNVNAEISVIEYSDFSCPFCKKIHPTLQKVVDEFDGKVNWVYRHFPLSFHDPLATQQAVATECAAEQGNNDAFWKMSDAIFEDPQSTDLAAMAIQIGLDEDEFTSCLESGKFEQHIRQDISEGSQAGVTGTPGNIIINNKSNESRLVSGAQPFASFKSSIEELMQK